MPGRPGTTLQGQIPCVYSWKDNVEGQAKSLGRPQDVGDVKGIECMLRKMTGNSEILPKRKHIRQEYSMTRAAWLSKSIGTYIPSPCTLESGCWSRRPIHCSVYFGIIPFHSPLPLFLPLAMLTLFLCVSRIYTLVLMSQGLPKKSLLWVSEETLKLDFWGVLKLSWLRRVLKMGWVCVTS